MAIYSMKASGNVTMSRFVKIDTSADGLVAQASTGEKTFGVSQHSSRRVPYSSLDDGYAAIDGEDLEVYGPNEECPLEISATVSPGDRLKSDSSGKGTPVASNNDEYGAVAKQSGTSGQLIRVQVVPFGQYGV